MKVTKTHDKDQAIIKYKKSKNNLQKEIRCMVEGMIEEHKKDKEIEPEKKEENIAFFRLQKYLLFTFLSTEKKLTRD